MPKYVYEGRDISGEKATGEVVAETRREAVIDLKGYGIAVTYLVEHRESILTKEIYLSNRVKKRDFVIFLRQFSALLEAGIPIVQSIEILSEQTESRVLKRTLLHIMDDIKDGQSLSEAASKFPKVFPAMFINLVQAGELSGTLDESLTRIGDYYERQYELKQKIISALTYPIILATIAIIVVNFMFLFVVPQFTSIYSSVGGQLPLVTRIILILSDFTRYYWWIPVLFLGLMTYVVYRTIQRKSSKYYLDYAILKVPIFGKLLQKSAMAQFSRTLSSLFASSVPILQSIQIVEKVIGNEVVSQAVSQSKQALEKGDSITSPLKEHWVFPPLVIQMMSVGEKTGTLDTMLLKVAKFYETDVEEMTDRLRTLLEPLLIVVMSVIVGGIVLAIVLPMFEMFNNI